MNDRARPALALTALTALSGACTLAAEAVGARLLRPLLGSTGFAQTGAVVGVLGGLGLGAWLTARALARGTLTPRRALVGAHVILALFALTASFVAAPLAVPIARALVSLGEASEALADVLRLALGVGLTALPGALAGSALPTSVLVLRRGAGAGTAWAGAASSFGAALGVALVTFVVGPAWGVASALRLVAVGYALAALLGWSATQNTPAPPPPESPSAQPLVTDRVLLVTVVLLGVASTGWQTVTTRLGELSFGPSAFALAAALAAHVSALALGELVALRWITRTPPERHRDALGRVVLFAAGMSLVALPLALRLPSFAEARLAHGAPPLTTLWATAWAFIAAASLPVVGTLGAAMAFAASALATRDGSARDDRAAALANGRLLVTMGAGNVLGAVLVSFAVMPLARVEGAMLFVCALLALAAWNLLRPAWPRALAALGAMVLVAGYGVAGTWREPERLLSGPFLYAGSTEVDLGRVVWRRDGREATVAVRRDAAGGALLQINGKVDATSEGDATTQTVVGIVPVAMARNPREVLVVGLGSGMTADAARSVPGVTRVTVAELIPEVVRAARADFARANAHVLDDPRVTVRAMDAAQYLRGTRRRFDAIVSEPSNPWVAGMSDLFTREVFEAARERLNPGGTFGAWFHAYSTDAETVASIVATFTSVFPRATLVEVTAGEDYLLVGVREPYALDMDEFLARTAVPGVASRLARAGIDDRASLIARFLSGTDGARAVARGGTVLRASDLTLEFRAPALLYHEAMADVFALLARIQDLPLAGLGADARAGGAWLRVIDESELRREAVTHTRNLVLAEREGSLARAIHEGELAVGLNPGDSRLRTLVARLYLRRSVEKRLARDPGGAEEDLSTALELNPHAAERFRALVSLGDLALRRHDGRRALDRFTAALAIARAQNQSSSELHVRMAEALAQMGAPDEAARELDRAIAETTSRSRREALEALRYGRSTR